MICGLMHCRNDEWCIGYTARVACQWVDKLLVYAHACTDKTIDILEQVKREYQGNVCILIDPEPEWREMDHRQFMLEWARQLKATHIVIIDSDEALTSNLLPDIRGIIEMTPRNHVLAIPGIQLWGSLGRYRIDRPFTTTFTLAFADDARLNYRPKPNGDQHHNGRQPMPLTEGFKPAVEGGILHLQFCRLHTLRWKQLRYACAELLKHGSDYGVQRINRRYDWWNYGPVATVPVTDEWWQPGHHLEVLASQRLFDDGSWYKSEVLKMIEQHGKAKFAGLQDFGLGVL